MNKIIFATLALCVSLLSFSQSRQIININNDWQFTPGYEVHNNIFTKITLPHTWNMDAMSGKIDYYRGFGNYQKKIYVPEDWEGNVIFLRFGAVNHTATVQINGETVGEHQGGYSAFDFDISDKLNYGTENTILVRVSNALDLGIMPLVGDFNSYGGIYRDVDILLLPKNHISVNRFASNGVRIIQKCVTKNSAELVVRIAVEGKGRLNVKLKNKEGITVVSTQQNITQQSGKQIIEVPFSLKMPHLWNGRKDPYLYSAEIEFGTDKVIQPFGLRYFEVDAQNRFRLNGELLQLHGVGRHQDNANAGNAIYRTQMETDIQIMLEMGVNAVRLTHYPHDPYFIELCDKEGIIVWSEIPFVGPGGYRDKGFVNTRRFRENGKQQLAEMIEQLYNHPSILFWGIFNELKEEGDNPLEYVKELNTQAKADDPTRLTVAASNQSGDLNFITDLIGFNQYFGWYGGNPSDVGSWAVGMHEKYPGIKLSISEYGAGASPFHQQEILTKPVATSRWHPENWQTHFHEEHWKVINEHNYFWGTFVWVMFDFYAAHRTEGERDGINDKGLVSIDRFVKKDAFYFYKANWNKENPFVYVSERRNSRRKNSLQTLKVYSNTESVELFLDGKSIGRRLNNGYGTFVWENCLLNNGKNTIEAVSKDKNVSDKIEIEII
ncbi:MULTISPECIES: glycoside hydrolase family 2 protein [Proteiniphilum]|jgi:beta-galactosidase|uniref:glycoside hydrolase family 2 protein n=1 Tax=Proteiniphilum TaxID=294702 RepID=UPI001EEC8060|nr:MULTISPECIES: glycoside hydrolase family 2 TIM barrel-domain containing protein [Proteiniphilum]ULB35111.1 DUF4982 domain-containing protein [Proteiniphilum propionicum]